MPRIGRVPDITSLLQRIDYIEFCIEQIEAFYSEIKGHYIMNVSANTTNPPRLYVPNGDGKMRIANAGEIYSGCYARVYLNFYAYNNKSAGIGAGLRSVCKVRDGEVLGEAGMSDTDAFGAEVVADNTGDEFM